jgi:hypothetical protein
MVTFSSSKAITNKSFSLNSYLFTLFTFFRIVPILFLAPQAAHPGMVNCTILSSATATPINTDKKTSAKNTLNIFFMFRLCYFLWSYDNSKPIKKQI